MTTYEYKIERVSVLVTAINEPMDWVQEQMNKFGALGQRIIGPPIEFQEPGTVTDANGRAIPYYGVVLFTEIVKEDENVEK